MTSFLFHAALATQYLDADGSVHEFRPALGWLASLIIVIVVSALSVAVQLMMATSAPKQDGPDPAKLSDFDIATAEDGRIIPVLFGTRLLHPNLLWYGHLKDSSIKKKKQKIGYRYRLGMLYAIGGEIDALVEFRMNETKMWAGEITDNYDGAGAGQFTAVTGYRGKPGSKGDQTQTTVRVYLGTQVAPDSYIEARIDADYGDGGEVVYKGMSLLVFPQGYIGDNVRNVPPYSVVARRTLFNGDLGGTETIWSTDANPVNVIYYIANTMLKIPSGMLDGAGTFASAIVTVKNEGLGVSFAMQEGRAAKEWIDEICRHIDAQFYFDETDGLFKIRLIRGDYDPEDLSTINEDWYRNLTFTRRAGEDVYTDIEVRWTPKDTWKERGTKLTNPAGRAILGYQKSKSISWPMFVSRGSVVNAVRRLKRRMFKPLAAGKFELAADALPLNQDGNSACNPGDVFRLVNTREDFDSIIRILGVSGGDSADGMLEIEFMEDMFTTTLEDDEPGEGEFDPDDYLLDDPVRYPVVKDAPPSMVPDLVGSVFVCATKPETGICGFYEVGRGEPAAEGEDDDEDDLWEQRLERTGLLTTGGYPVTGEIDDDVGFTIEDGIRMAARANTRAEAQAFKTLAMIDSGGADFEIISIQTIAESGSDWLASGIIRGLYGTEIQAHSAGARVWIVWEDFGEFLVVPVRLRQDDYSFAPANAYVTGPTLEVANLYNRTVERPYPPDNLIAERDGDTAVLSWTPRNRLQGQGAAHWDPDETPAFDGIPEGQWEVVDADGYGPAIAPDPYHVREGIATAETYTVRSELAGRYSAGVDVEI
jgi:hypothetical protein